MCALFSEQQDTGRVGRRAIAVRTGEQFLAGLQDNREVWLEGERVPDMTSHPKMARMARTLPGIYALQHSPALHEKMTVSSPTS